MDGPTDPGLPSHLYSFEDARSHKWHATKEKRKKKKEKNIIIIAIAIIIRKWRNHETLSFVMKNYNCSCTLRSSLNCTKTNKNE